ncbi:MAG: CofH family radical SAM protein [Bacteroidales bacterium]|nr:CofH family radical SAM protein [Bacteroidales bacterium]
MVNLEKFVRKWYEDESLDLNSFSQALWLYPLEELIGLAHDIRLRLDANGRVGYVVERNINYTNVCVIGCKFCTYHCSIQSKKGFVLSQQELFSKISELVDRGGRQVFLQGGIHPFLPLSWYVDMLQFIKTHFPHLRIHAFSPVEIYHIAKRSQMSIENVLKVLQEAGLDYLPGAGAEILVERVRKIVSPKKISDQEWLNIMHIAHEMGLPTSATMMYGHVETLEERIEHLRKIYLLQKNKPANTPGFVAFIPWPYVGNKNSIGSHKFVSPHTAVSYLRLIAISRILLNNIPILQASWLTVGIEVAQMALHAGANDMGSILIEEKVITGGKHQPFPNETEIQQIIRDAGFIPFRRN